MLIYAKVDQKTSDSLTEMRTEIGLLSPTLYCPAVNYYLPHFNLMKVNDVDETEFCLFLFEIWIFFRLDVGIQCLRRAFSKHLIQTGLSDTSQNESKTVKFARSIHSFHWKNERIYAYFFDSWPLAQLKLTDLFFI